MSDEPPAIARQQHPIENRTKQLIKALYEGRDDYVGMVTVVFNRDGTTSADVAGIPEQNVQAFLFACAVLFQVASGTPIKKASEPVIEKSPIIL